MTGHLKTWVFVGLGNPGRKFEMTRHNLGFLVVKALAKKWLWKWKEEREFRAHISKGHIKEVEVHLLLPMTYMNCSGEAVKKYLDYYRLGPENLIVISDDIALPFGEMRLRLMGSAGGHNGLKSVEEWIKTRHYKRLRMGVGEAAVTEKSILSEYVLDTFNEQEKKGLEKFIEQAVEVLERLLSENISHVMSACNAKRHYPI